MIKLLLILSIIFCSSYANASAAIAAAAGAAASNNAIIMDQQNNLNNSNTLKNKPMFIKCKTLALTNCLKQEVINISSITDFYQVEGDWISRSYCYINFIGNTRYSNLTCDKILQIIQGD